MAISARFMTFPSRRDLGPTMAFGSFGTGREKVTDGFCRDGATGGKGCEIPEYRLFRPYGDRLRGQRYLLMDGA
jgi:hypothetical protein